MKKISNLGEKIKLQDKEYTIFENDVEWMPFRLLDEKERVFYLMSKDPRSTVYYLIDAAFNTKFQITKDELVYALEPPMLYWNPNSINLQSFANGGIITAGNPNCNSPGGNIPNPFLP